MEKVGKMVFKMKPSKSGINKLPLFRQFRPACKNWGSSDETFCRTWKFPAKRYMYNFYSTFAREGPLPLPNCFFCYTRPSSTLKVTCWIFVFGIFWNQKRAWSCIDIMCSSKYVDFYAFPLAMRPSGANANAQLILAGENFLKNNSDEF